jgi:two-component system LytT family response regulator
MRVTIIDDEPLAIEILEKFVNRTDGLELSGAYYDSSKALKEITENLPDLLLLDINMPEVTGFDLLKTLGDRKPMVIITTAYPDYALKSYEFEVIDYLMKPIPYTRFLQAVERARKRKKETLPATFFIKTDKRNIQINIDEISFIESQEDYIKINFINKIQGSALARLSLKNMQGRLPAEKFLRVHKSFIVNISEIASMSDNQLLLRSQSKVPIGRTYQSRIKAAISEITLNLH